MALRRLVEAVSIFFNKVLIHGHLDAASEHLNIESKHLDIENKRMDATNKHFGMKSKHMDAAIFNSATFFTEAATALRNICRNL